MANLLTFSSGRNVKWIVAGFWLFLILVSVGTNLIGKFTDAEENESTSFLPGDAESTKALEVTERVQGGEQAPIVIVYRATAG